MVNIINTEIPGVKILEPAVFGDDRGYFMESYRSSILPRVEFIQDNESKSSFGVVRGLHFQKGPVAQAKLVRVVCGRVLDVAVDLRTGSETFGRHICVELSDENHRQLFIPRGFAHGFSVLSETAIFQYKCDDYYEPSAEGGIAWDDPEIGIDWQIPAEKVLLSPKDSKRPTLSEYVKATAPRTILVTGANGQLGLSVRRLAEGSSDRFIFTDICQMEGVRTTILNITDAGAVAKMAADNKVDVIINCAAYTNVDKAEDDESTAYLINCAAAENLAKAAKDCGALLIHISTDYVFGAGVTERRPLGENEPTIPESAYGRTKLAGEQAIAASGCRYVIIRTAWLYSEYGRNFVKTMLRLFAEKPSVSVVDDQFGTPTYAGDLAKAVLAVAAQDPESGIYHFTDEGQCSWFEFAAEICRQATGKDDIVHPCTSAQYPSKVKRPAWSVLDKSGIRERFGIVVPGWRESLAVCLKNMTEYEL